MTGVTFDVSLDVAKEQWKYIEHYIVVKQIWTVKKRPMLFSVMVPKMYGLLHSLGAPKPGQADCDCVLTFCKHCATKCSWWQKDSSSTSRREEAQYVVGLQELLGHCELGAYMYDALRDTFAWVKAWNCRGVFDCEITYVFRKQWMHVTYNSWTALLKCTQHYYKEVTDAATVGGQITLIVVYWTVAPVAEVYNNRQDGVPVTTRVRRDIDLVQHSSFIYNHWYSQH